MSKTVVTKPKGLKELVKKGFLEPKEALDQLLKRDPSVTSKTPIVRWLRRRSSQ